MEIDIELLHKERKQWRENSLLQSKSILRLSQELDNLRKQKEILQENYILKEKLDILHKEYDKNKFKNEEKIKDLENKVSHLTVSLSNANQTIEVCVQQ